MRNYKDSQLSYIFCPSKMTGDTKAVIFYLQNTLSPETDMLTNRAHDFGDGKEK